MTEGTSGPTIDQEAKEIIVPLAHLFDRFGRHIEPREEELWAHTERMITLVEVNKYWKSLEKWILQLELKAQRLENELVL